MSVKRQSRKPYLSVHSWKHVTTILEPKYLEDKSIIKLIIASNPRGAQTESSCIYTGKNNFQLSPSPKPAQLSSVALTDYFFMGSEIGYLTSWPLREFSKELVAILSHTEVLIIWESNEADILLHLLCMTETLFGHDRIARLVRPGGRQAKVTVNRKTQMLFLTVAFRGGAATWERP